MAPLWTDDILSYVSRYETDRGKHLLKKQGPRETANFQWTPSQVKRTSQWLLQSYRLLLPVASLLPILGTSGQSGKPLYSCPCLTRLSALCVVKVFYAIRRPSEVGGRLTVKSVYEFAYGTTDEKEVIGQAGKKVAIYIRVSTLKQDIAGSLARQRSMLIEEVSSRENIPVGDVAVYSDTASSFGNRPSFNDLCLSIVEGSIKKVYALYEDRLARDSTKYLFYSICEKYGVEVVCLDKGEEEDEKDILTRELLQFITVISNRNSAQKAKKVCEKVLTPEVIERIINLRAMGNNLTFITAQLQKEGFVNPKDSTPISVHSIRKVLKNGKGSARSQLVTGTSTAIDLEKVVKDFVEEKSIKVDNPKSKISTNDIYPSYSSYCQRLNLLPMNRVLLGTTLTKLLGTKTVKNGGVRHWIGLEK